MRGEKDRCQKLAARPDERRALLRTPFSCAPLNASHGERIFSASATESASASVMNQKEALAFVERHGIVLQAARGPLPNLAETIAGGAG